MDEMRLFIGSDKPAQERVDRDQDNALEAWPEHGLFRKHLGASNNGRKR